MKIYLGESKNFMGYMLIGDLGQEYITNIYPKNKELIINIYEKCLEMALFYVYKNNLIYSKESPKIYLYNAEKSINQIDILNFKDYILKNSFFKKYKKDTSQALIVKDIKDYQEHDLERIKYISTQLDIKERDMLLLANKLCFKNR